jgi:hypothetical protein
VTLKLIFDDPRHPDFELDLWLPGDQQRRESRSPADAIQEANRWLLRATPSSAGRKRPALRPRKRQSPRHHHPRPLRSPGPSRVQSRVAFRRRQRPWPLRPPP